MVDRIMAPQNAHLVNPKICVHVMLHRKMTGVIEVIHGIMVVNQLTLKQGSYPGLSGWAQSNYEGPYMWKTEEVSKPEKWHHKKDLTEHGWL